MLLTVIYSNAIFPSMKNFKQFWQQLAAKDKQSMADRLDTHKDYLSQIAHGYRNPGKHFKNALVADIAKLERKAA